MGCLKSTAVLTIFLLAFTWGGVNAESIENTWASTDIKVDGEMGSWEWDDASVVSFSQRDKNRGNA